MKTCEVNLVEKSLIGPKLEPLQVGRAASLLSDELWTICDSPNVWLYKLERLQVESQEWIHVTARSSKKDGLPSY